MYALIQLLLSLSFILTIILHIFAVAIICYLSQTINTLNMNYKLLFCFFVFFVRLTHEKLMMYSCIWKRTAVVSAFASRWVIVKVSASRRFSLWSENLRQFLCLDEPEWGKCCLFFLPSPYHHRLPPTCWITGLKLCWNGRNIWLKV